MWIIVIHLEIATYGVFRKISCWKTCLDGLTSSDPPERRLDLHVKKVEPCIFQDTKPNTLHLAAIAIGQEQRFSANLIQDASGIATENAATDQHPYEFMRSAIGEVGVPSVRKPRTPSSVNFWLPKTLALGQVISDTMTRCPFEHVDGFPLRPRQPIAARRSLLR